MCAYRLTSIQFEGRDPVDIDGDVVPSTVARYRPACNPVESAVPRDAALIYQLRPCLLSAQRAASQQGAGEEPRAAFSCVPADSKTPNARVLLTGNLKPTGSHAGPGPEETGEGRRSDPNALEVSSDESEEEEVPKRGASSPPPIGQLESRGPRP